MSLGEMTMPYIHSSLMNTFGPKMFEYLILAVNIAMFGIYLIFNIITFEIEIFYKAFKYKIECIMSCVYEK